MSDDCTSKYYCIVNFTFQPLSGYYKHNHLLQAAGSALFTLSERFMPCLAHLMHVIRCLTPIVAHIGSYPFCFFFFFCFFFGKAQAVTRRLCSGICLFLLMLFARAYATFRRFCLNFAFFFVGKYAFSSQLVQVQQYPTWYTFYGRCRSIYSADCSGLLCW